MTEHIELLTTDDDGHAIEGPKYPYDLNAIVWQAKGEAPLTANQRLAYPHKFFKRDEHGQPVPGTLVRFAVPDHLCDGPWPSDAALRLVAERMGWDGDR